MLKDVAVLLSSANAKYIHKFSVRSLAYERVDGTTRGKKTTLVLEKPNTALMEKIRETATFFYFRKDSIVVRFFFALK